ncbi:MAG TPA: prepilin peptidase [Alphaproteobacteria bacterium]|nr:prepilin peptidase [Alphaproteobacteria bacterium]
MILFLLLFLGIMAAAAIYDLVSYTIPNFLSILLIVIFAALAVWQGLSWQILAAHGGTGLSMLAVGYAMFAAGLMGGGDAKLFAATSLWMGWQGMFNYLIMFSLCGGLLALALLLFRRLPLPEGLGRHGWIMALHNPAQGVPYGIALAAGASLALPDLLGIQA